VFDDDKAQFPPQRMARHDAEVTTDVGDDGADRPAADLGGDLRRGGQASEARVRLAGGGRCGRPGCARPGLRRSSRGRRIQTVGAADDLCLQRVGAVQAAGDASKDQRYVGGAEAAYDGGGIGEGALPDRGGEFLAVVDELVDEFEQAPRAARLGGWIRGFGRGGHGRDKGMRRGRVARNIFRLLEKGPRQLPTQGGLSASQAGRPASARSPWRPQEMQADHCWRTLKIGFRL
jgi:hypothetical protein